MELAVHLRDPSQLEELDRIPSQLSEFYGTGEIEKQDWARSIPDCVQRVYTGDEFCIHRMPDPGMLEETLQGAANKSWDVTLLTPPVTNEGLERCLTLFRFLEQHAPETEVVVNDWGLLGALRENHPALPVAAGRLLNKGFKDPRLVDPEGAEEISEEAQELLNGCTFDTPSFQEKLREMDVRRFERDLLPYGEPRTEGPDGIGASVYFPFGYVSTGRVCWIASFKAPAGRKFTPLEACHGPCNGLLLEMGSTQSSFQLFQGGNTVFYLYPLPIFGSLVKDSTHEGVRLVYQGIAI